MTKRSISVAFLILELAVGSVLVRARAEEPKLTPAQQAKLDEARKLTDQSVQLYDQRKYAEAMKLTQQALEIQERALGKDHSAVALSLSNLATLYENQRNYSQAEPLYQRALKIYETAHGPDYPLVANTLYSLAALYANQQKYSQAEPLYLRALKIREKAFGPNHLETAQSLNGLAGLYHTQGNYSQAEPLYERALKIKEKTLDADNPGVATSLGNLALLYYAQGKYSQAEPLLQRAVAIREKSQGVDHPDLATVLNNLAGLYLTQGKYSQAEPLFRRTLEIWEKTLGPDHPDVAKGLNNLAILYTYQDKYSQAEPLYLRALKIREKALGPDHPDLATSLSSVAYLYKTQGKFSQAEPLFQRALKIKEKAYGPDHPAVATSLSEVASMYDTQGRYSQAEPLYQRALKIQEKALGPDHPDVARSLNNLALLYKTLGNYAQAEPLYRRALKINEAHGPETRDVALSLANLAELFRAQHNYSEAELLSLRALKIREKALGPDHGDVAMSLSNLGVLYEEQELYSDAEQFFLRALEIKENALPNHPDVARSLNNLAELFSRQGKYARAAPLYHRAIRVFEESLSPGHPSVAKVITNLAAMQMGLEHWPDAAKSLDRARRLIRRHVTRELPALNVKEQLAFLQTTDGDQFQAALSLGLAQRNDAAIASQSAGWLTNGKALTQEALTQNMLLARESDDPQVGAKVKELLDVRRQLAALVYQAVKPGEEAKRREQMKSLQAQEETLARQIGQATGGRVGGDPWVETDQVRKTIPADGLMIDIARFKIYNFQAKGKEKNFGAPHYAAWLIPSAGKGEIQIIDLGEAEQIDGAVQAVRVAMQQAMGAGSTKGVIQAEGEEAAEQLIQKPLAELAKLVWEPLAPQLGADTKQLIISPDAALWLVPWGALPIGEGQYAIEKYNLRYVVSGRDLVAQRSMDKKPTKPVVIADPNYDLGPSEVQSATRSVLRGAVAANNNDIELRSLSAGKSNSALPKVGRLAGTAAEAAAIKPKLTTFAKQEPVTYLDKYATEGVFKAVQRPQVLVLSTHGFFLPDQEVKRDEKAGTLAVGEQRSASALTVDGQPVENPLLRCGILLAGCNQDAAATTPGTGEDTDDGILTGMEIVGTDLRGTELVVLSACETGLGQVRNGEGVAGLRQAFQLAGAKSVVATLWQIPDKDSARLMSDFFTNLAAGQSKPEALRNAQLGLIQSHRQKYAAAHPFFWAAFTITGE